MTADQFKDLKVGDLVEAKSLFPKLTDAPTVLKVSSIEKGQARMLASWMGVTLGVWIGEVVRDKVEWSFS